MAKLQIDGVDIAEIEGFEAEGLLGLAKDFGLARLNNRLCIELRRDYGHPQFIDVRVKPVEVATTSLDLMFRRSYL